MSALDIKVVAAEPAGADNLVAWLSFASSAITALAWPLTVVVLVLLMRKHIPHLLAVLKRLKGPGFEAEFERKVDALDAAVQASASGAPIVDTTTAISEAEAMQVNAPAPDVAPAPAVDSPTVRPPYPQPHEVVDHETPQTAVPLSLPTNGMERAKFYGRLKRLLNDSQNQIAEARKLAASAPRATVLMTWIEVEKVLRTAANAVGLPSHLPASKLIDILQSDDLISPMTSIACHDLRELRNKASHDHDFRPDEDSIQKFVSVAESVIGNLINGLVHRVRPS